MMTLKSGEGRPVWKNKVFLAPHISAETDGKMFGCNLGMELAAAEENVRDALINDWLTVETPVWQTVEKAIPAPRMYQTRIV